MIESGVGRTERAELGERRGEPRALAEPDDGEVRKPAAALPLVHAQPLEPPVEVVGERDRPSALVVEDEHADAPRLAVAGDGESGAPGGRGRLPELAGDRGDIRGGSAPEEGQGDVEVRPDDAADAVSFGKRPAAPGDEAVEDVVGETQGAEEPDRRIAPHATDRIHTRSCRSCVRRRRTRWSAETAARRRIVSRSAGRLKSTASSPSGPAACR